MEPGCDRQRFGRGLCAKHYQRLRATGERERVLERFQVAELEQLRTAHRTFWDEAGVPYGHCLCGCGETTSIANVNSRHAGTIKGEPRRYRTGHACRRRSFRTWTVEDRGYETPCWIWGGNIQARGYGMYRNMYRARKGPIPEGLELDHLCRVRECVNPDHLEPVSRRVNLRRGDGTKLTEDQVREIKRRAANMDVAIYAKARALAEDYPVSPEGVRAILRGKSWVDV